MSYHLSFRRMNQILHELQREYRVFAPVRFEKRGRFSDTDMIRYAEIQRMEDIVHEEKSAFSPKEVFFPITQSILQFTEFDYRESPTHDKKLLVFARPCDINGVRRLDRVLLENGGYEDYYYKRLREKVKFVLMECREGWDTCFCVSMGANATKDYSLAVRFQEGDVDVEVREESFQPLFAGETPTDFSPEFVAKNEVTVRIPAIRDRETLAKVKNLDMWKSYDKRCQSCGACNAVCITCSCFTTSDVVYTENGDLGERRRVWASCQHEDFTAMAGGHRFRVTPGSRLRFRALHKVYDYKERFKTEHMCVGCGRCTDHCPEFISFSTMINRLSDEVEKLNGAEVL